MEQCGAVDKDVDLKIAGFGIRGEGGLACRNDLVTSFFGGDISSAWRGLDVVGRFKLLGKLCGCRV